MDIPFKPEGWAIVGQTISQMAQTIRKTKGWGNSLPVQVPNYIKFLKLYRRWSHCHRAALVTTVAMERCHDWDVPLPIPWANVEVWVYLCFPRRWRMVTLCPVKNLGLENIPVVIFWGVRQLYSCKEVWSGKWPPGLMSPGGCVFFQWLGHILSYPFISMTSVLRGPSLTTWSPSELHSVLQDGS